MVGYAILLMAFEGIQVSDVWRIHLECLFTGYPTGMPGVGWCDCT